MPVIIDGTNGITQADQFNSDSTFGFKNRIINGAMVIDQRGGTISATGLGNTYGVDRWQMRTTASSAVVSMQQSTTAPTGFINSFLLTVTTADASLASDDLTCLVQKIEGFNVADLGWGTANAKTVTLSFWVRSNVTGTYGAGVQNNASNRSYPSSFVINSADTFEYKTITIPGDTSGTWLTNSGVGIYLWFSLAAGTNYIGTANAWAGADYRGTTGQVNWGATLSNTFYITGVQLEVGSTATSFDYRPIGTELALCQRYYWQQGGSQYTRFAGGIALGRSSTVATSMAIPPVTMRTFPTVSSTNIGNTAINGTAVSSISVDSATDFGPIRVVANLSGLSTGTGYEWESNNNTTTRVTYSSEL